jgi:hypothetical protein
MEELPPKTRAVFILYRVDRLSYRDIAAALDISPRTVEYHLRQALIQCRQRLTQEEDSPSARTFSADCALRGFNELFNGPTRPRHADDLLQGCVLRGKEHIGPQLRWVAETAPDQQPAAPRRVDRFSQRPPAPVLPPRSLRSFARTQAPPPILGQGRQKGFHWPLLPIHPDIVCARDGQHIGLGRALQPQPQAPISAIDAVACNPLCRQARGGFVAKRRSSGLPACRQRSWSVVHAWGRDSSRSSQVWPS